LIFQYILYNTKKLFIKIIGYGLAIGYFIKIPWLLTYSKLLGIN